MFRPILLCLLPFAASAEPFCEGRYMQASEIIDAAYGQYGTLYAGGGHWHRRDNLGPTLDLWRLLRGETDLDLRRADDLIYGWADDPLAVDGVSLDRHQLFAGFLPVLDDPNAPPPDDRDAYILATTADLITTLGPGGIWWRQDGTLGLSEAEAQTAALAQTVDVVDWLQIAALASDAPWAYGWHLGADRTKETVLQDLSDDALARFEDGTGMEWLVASAITAAGPSGLLNMYTDELDVAVESCTATPGEFAARSILRLHQLRHGMDITAHDADLPATLRDIAHTSLTLRALTPRRWSQEALALPDGISHLRLGAANIVWENAARTYLAHDVTTLIDIHQGAPLHPYVLRALNALSTDDLTRFAQLSGRPAAEERAMLGTALARLFVLERFDDAEALLPRLKELSPDAAPDINDIQTRVWPQEVRLALILLALPEGQTWLRPVVDEPHWWGDVALDHRHRMARGLDLPIEMRTGAALQRDLETYLRLPSRWGGYRGVRGYAFHYLDRANDRQVRPGNPYWLPHITPERPDDLTLPIATLIAWDELHHFGPDTGVARRIAMALVPWVNRRTDTWIERTTSPQDDMAAALREVVLMARWNDIGALDGTPLARQAYALMHYRLYDSPATWDTPLWHSCSVRCER